MAAQASNLEARHARSANRRNVSRARALAVHRGRGCGREADEAYCIRTAQNTKLLCSQRLGGCGPDRTTGVGPSVVRIPRIGPRGPSFGDVELITADRGGAMHKGQSATENWDGGDTRHRARLVTSSSPAGRGGGLLQQPTPRSQSQVTLSRSMRHRRQPSILLMTVKDAARPGGAETRQSPITRGRRRLKYSSARWASLLTRDVHQTQTSSSIKKS